MRETPLFRSWRVASNAPAWAYPQGPTGSAPSTSASGGGSKFLDVPAKLETPVKKQKGLGVPSIPDIRSERQQVTSPREREVGSR